MSTLLGTIRRGGTTLARVAAGAVGEGKPLTGPLYVQFGIVNPCNYQCVFCWDQADGIPDEVAAGYYEDHDRDDHMGAMMDYDLYARTVVELAAQGTRRIKLVGRGEPTLHPRLVEMIRHAKRHGLRVGLTTNGSRLTKELATEIVDAGVDELEISTNAASVESYDRIHRGGEGNFERVVEGARSIVRVRAERGREAPHLTLSFVVVRHNVHELGAMARLAGEVGADAAAFRQIEPFPGAEHLPLTAEDRPAVGAGIEQARAEAGRRGLSTNLDYFHDQIFGSEIEESFKGQPCYAGYYFSVILADGSVHPCCQSLRELGDLRTEGFADVWRGARYQEFREQGFEPRSDSIPGARCGECGLCVQNAVLRAGRRGQGVGGWLTVLSHWNRTFLDR
ncbi:MAG: radical SAM protein [Myxococcales bacterium]|nr:radical SAM protein [Myxococcales bacterium]